MAYKDGIYVFGGEVGFSAGTETPLWVYQIKVGHVMHVATAGCGLFASFNLLTVESS